MNWKNRREIKTVRMKVEKSHKAQSKPTQRRAKLTFSTSTPLAWTESQREEKKHQLDGPIDIEDIR